MATGAYSSDHLPFGLDAVNVQGYTVRWSHDHLRLYRHLFSMLGKVVAAQGHCHFSSPQQEGSPCVQYGVFCTWVWCICFAPFFYAYSWGSSDYFTNPEASNNRDDFWRERCFCPTQQQWFHVSVLLVRHSLVFPYTRVKSYWLELLANVLSIRIRWV